MPHYFDSKPEVRHQICEINVRLRGRDFSFLTDRGVFSRQRLDFGTELLINTVCDQERTPSGRLLDLGCGYGPVGIIMKRLFPALDVEQCDINERALELARQNAKLNKVNYNKVILSDGMASVAGQFDLIMTNPPIRAGKTVVQRFFAEAAARLQPGGRLYVVIQKKQGAPSALKRLQQLFTNAAVIEHKAGYWIIRACDARSLDEIEPAWIAENDL